MQGQIAVRKHGKVDVVPGGVSGGADEIVVTDGHWNSSNILIEKLDSRARLNSGTPAPFSVSGTTKDPL